MTPQEIQAVIDKGGYIIPNDGSFIFKPNGETTSISGLVKFYGTTYRTGYSEKNDYWWLLENYWREATSEEVAKYVKE